MLKGMRLYFPAQTVPAPSSSLEALRIAQQNAEYQRMVGIEEEHEQGEIKSVIAMANVVLSVVGIFVAVYWATQSLTDDVAVRVLAGLLAATVVGAAEAWLFVRASKNSQRLP